MKKFILLFSFFVLLSSNISSQELISDEVYASWIGNVAEANVFIHNDWDMTKNPRTIQEDGFVFHIADNQLYKITITRTAWNGRGCPSSILFIFSNRSPLIMNIPSPSGSGSSGGGIQEVFKSNKL